MKQFRIYYSMKVNGEEYNRSIKMEGKDESDAERRLRNLIATDVEMHISRTVQIS
jgi:hypothetical protein